MKRKNLPNNIIEWYCNLLKDRKVTVDLQGVTKTIVPQKGSPQGGILSPLVWNLVMDTLLSSFKREPVKVVGYADDIIIMASGIDPKTLAERVQKAINFTLNWGKKKVLTFNPNKTQTIVFERAMKYQARVPPLKVGETILEYATEIEYLGMIIQKRLTWAKNLEKQIKKSNMLLNRARSVIAREWGLTPERLLWVYTAMTRPKLTYGALVWAHNITETNRKLMNKVQRKILIACSGSMRSTPTEAMEAIMGLLPLDIYVEEIAIRTRARTKYYLKDTWDGLSKGGKTLVCGHRRVWDKILENLGSLEPPVIRENSWLTWDEYTNIETDIRVYTDGASGKNGAGIGYTVYKNKETKP